MSTAIVGQSVANSERRPSARRGRPPVSSMRLLIEAVRDGIAARGRYDSKVRQGVPHADAIGHAMSVVD